jgi:uncharacterized protein (TIGR00369 family)
MCQRAMTDPMRGVQVDPQLEIWREPVRGGYPDPAMLGLPGIEQLRAFLDGRTRQSPLGRLTGLRLTEVGAGKSTFVMPASPWFASPEGVMTLGTLAVLADGPLATAILTALPPATASTTAELSLRALRPVRLGTTLTAKGHLIYAGRTVALSDVAIEDHEGRLVAHGSSLCFVFPPQPPPPGPPAAPAPEPHYATPDPHLRPVVGEVLPQSVWDQMSGLEGLKAALAGELPAPPARYLFGLRLLDASEGQAAFALPASEWLCPPSGRVQGGVIAMLADTALAAALGTLRPAGAAIATIDLKVNFLRPAPADGRDLVARGKVDHAGRTIVVAHSEVVNADGKQVALATGSAVLLPGRAASLTDLKLD